MELYDGSQLGPCQITAVDFTNPTLIFGASALIINQNEKTISVGQDWSVDDASKEVIRIMTEHFGLERAE